MPTTPSDTDTESESAPWTLHDGDAFDVLDDAETLPDESVHAIVCDPPYGINFMPGATNGWDDFDPKEYQEWCQEWAEKALRVVKPGGHLLAFSGERTFHRLMVGVEDAGWTVRTSIMWLHGEGFPKGSDVSKHIDRYYDAEDEREVVGEKDRAGGMHRNSKYGWKETDGDEDSAGEITAPATDEARQWQGWKSQLKPAHEPIVVARKPLSEDAIYKNVLEHGTGAYNVDECRIPTDGERPKREVSDNDYEGELFAERGTTKANGTTAEGRYPANVVLDEQAAAMLDAQSGEFSGHKTETGDGRDHAHNEIYGVGAGWGRRDPDNSYDDEGGASRFYYTSKAPKSERTHDGEVENDHPTVKPVDLLTWLVRMVTAEGQTVLDPFTGSGTTGVACLKEDRRFIGIEREDEYREIARQRLEHTTDEVAQQTLADAAETADATDANADD